MLSCEIPRSMMFQLTPPKINVIKECCVRVALHGDQVRPICRVLSVYIRMRYGVVGVYRTDHC
jgi:hypothetical protein